MNVSGRVGSAVGSGGIGVGGSFAGFNTSGSLTTAVNLFGQSSYMNGVSKVVQVPVQDSRTKALIYKLAT